MPLNCPAALAYAASCMLEPVTANQTRFVTPGLSLDARGVALGRYCAVLLPSFDRLVGLFEGLSDRLSLDDLLPALQILQVETPLKSRELIVQLPVSNSHMADLTRGVATLMGGLVFTGSAKHFVQLRDRQAPLGYDVDALHAGQGDIILYANDFTQSYVKQRELSFADLVLSLSLRPDPVDRVAADAPVLLRVVAGLWKTVVTYLHRNNLLCEVSACQSDTDGESLFLVRTRLQTRMERLFRSTPGIEVYHMLTESVAIQAGFSHPINLDACGSIFDEGTFYLFSGERDCLDTIRGGLVFVAASALVRLDHRPERTARPVPLRPSAANGFEVPLRLVRAPGTRPAVRGSLIPLHQAPWLKQLVYLLPPTALHDHGICQTEQGIFLFSESPVEFFPLGTLFYQLALGLLVPIGFELLPRMHPEVLVQHLGAGADKLIFFEEQGPLGLRRADFTPLARHTLAHVQVQPIDGERPAAAPETAPTLCNEPLGLFPLWGFSDQDRGGDP